MEMVDKKDVPPLDGTRKRELRPYTPPNTTSPIIECLFTKCGEGDETQEDTVPQVLYRFTTKGY